MNQNPNFSCKTAFQKPTWRRLSILLYLLYSGFGLNAASTGAKIPTLALFSKQENGLKTAHPDLVQGAQYSILNYNLHFAANFVSRPQQEFKMELELPVKGKSTLLLKQQDLFGPNSRMINEKGETIENLSGGAYYSGKIVGDDESLVALSFFGDRVMGIISSSATGNLILGKSVSASLTEQSNPVHFLFAENDLKSKIDFSCGVVEQEDELELWKNTQAQLLPLYEVRCRKVRVHLECDYKLFQDQGRSSQSVKTYMTGLFNVVKTIYSNEYVNLEISDILVWTSQDPFLHTNLQSILFHYLGYRKSNFVGDLTQLVSTFQPSQPGGIAFVGTLCQDYNGQSGPHSYAFIYNNYSQLPTYSWSVYVMSHEMGHNFGSWHTHSCVWGPAKNKQLDNCQPPDVGSCSPGPAPTGGGTIMSYCHLTNYGVNLNKGFGKEPGDVLRNSVSTKECLENTITAESTRSSLEQIWEGDSLVLKADPKNKSYNFDWLHYEYPIPSAKDSMLTVRTSGLYRVAISNRCTEYSPTDTVKIEDFQVNLGCPVKKGKRDTVRMSLTMNADDSVLRDSFNFSNTAYSSIPSYAKDILVSVRSTIAPVGSSWTQSVQMGYTAPSGTNVQDLTYWPNEFEQYYYSGVKSYTKVLGNFDPKGKWVFYSIDGRPDAGIDAKVTQEVILSWRSPDTVLTCDIPLCDGNPRLFDAKIPGAQYNWSNGAKTQTTTVSTQGPLTVTVSKNGLSSSHTIRVTTKPTHFSAQHTICEGQSHKVGIHNYTVSGMYTDSLISKDGCDSIISTQLTVHPILRTEETVQLCYGDKYKGLVMINDSTIVNKSTSLFGCDSFHTVLLKVNPELKASPDIFIACDDHGAQVSINVTGGLSPYEIKWPDGFLEPNHNGIKSGQYKVSILDANQCPTSVEFNVKNHDSVGIKPTIKQILCAGKNDGSIELEVLSGTQPFFINWSHGSKDLKLENLAAGIYRVFITDQNGCQFNGEYEIKSPFFIIINVDVKGSTGMNNGTATAQVNGGTPPFQYKWSTGDTAMSIGNLAPGDYSLLVTDANGCTGNYFFSVPNSVGTKQFYQNSSINVYPNPGNGVYTVESEIPVNDYKIFDLQGKLILEQQQLKSEHKLKIDLSSFSAGLYYVEFKLNQHILVKKLLIKME
ncbi:MAG TPA: M12 family metallo-peptidase [Saprospiraceae bacterium]|nr:M12 family metallo-peptidase [Saprospiraceae bacterium]